MYYIYMADYRLYEKNGVHIIIYSLFIAYFFDPLLGFYYYLKMFAWSYYHNFNYLYDNPSLYKWKHLVRLTDTGHIANCLFYIYPQYLPICHNVQFVICAGYYIPKLFLGTKDKDDKEDPELFSLLQDIHSNLIHTVPYGILCYYNCKQDYEFTDTTLFYSYLWIYSWLLCVYLPWRFYTNDYVYPILEQNVPFTVKSSIIILLHIFVYTANQFGGFIQSFFYVLRHLEIR